MTMTKKQYLNLLVNEFHSATMATIGADGHPVTRIIDLMLWDESGVYFLTGKREIPLYSAYGAEIYRPVCNRRETGDFPSR